MAAPNRKQSRFFVTVFGVLFFYFAARQLLRSDPNKITYNYVKSGFDWGTVPQQHPITDVTPLPQGKPEKQLPSIQHNFALNPKGTDPARLTELLTRRDTVRAAFLKSWNAYKGYAWMKDELMPVSGTGKDAYGGWAATMVDSLDTLWIMDLKLEFKTTVGAVAGLDFNVTSDTAINFFETTIRHLGGLLSAYDLSKERVLLQKAIELGDMLYMAFDTSNRLPPFWLDFEKAKAGTQKPGTHEPAASSTSASLEFTRLAQLTGNNKYYDAVDRVSKFLQKTQNTTKLPGMWPTFLDLETGDLTKEPNFTLGALADSLYEYLPKMIALLGGLEPMYEEMYRKAADVMTKHLLFRPMLPEKDDILFTGSVYVTPTGPELAPEGQHLACFAGGMFALGGKLLEIPEHVKIGERLTKGCVWAYEAFPTGIMPEIFHLLSCPSLEPCDFDEEAWKSKGAPGLEKGFTSARDARYLLRPEAIESVFLMYRITGKPEYQDMAWKMFKAIQKATETQYAFSAIADVNAKGATEKLDSMESFWTAETLKYFYLIFASPDIISLDKYVLNTEAHPLKRWGTGRN